MHFGRRQKRYHLSKGFWCALLPLSLSLCDRSEIDLDIFTTEKRSQIMSRIRCRGAPAELRLIQLVRVAVRELLDRRTRVVANTPHIVGKPDAFVPSLRLAFFMDGCFFHGCRIHKSIPKTNSRFWSEKIDRNRRRDLRVSRKLRRQGFSVWRFWEHDLKVSRLDRTSRRVRMAIKMAADRQ